MNHLLSAKLSFIIERLLKMHVYLREARIELHHMVCFLKELDLSG